MKRVDYPESEEDASINCSRRLMLAAALNVGVIAAWPLAARAADYPQRPIRYVSPYPPGGTNDLVARIVSKRLGTLLGASIVVENRGGAGGTIGTTFAAHANTDGYTILNASSGNLTSAPQVIGATYKPLDDFVPIGFLGNIRFVFAVNPSLKVNTLHDLIAYAKAHPGTINYGTAGIGTGGHLTGEYLKLRTGIDIVHVPYRGSAPALTDAIAGHVQLVIDPLATQYVRSGELHGLAYSGASGAPDLPGVPSIDAAGVPNWEVTNFYLALVPAHTPPAIVAKLNDALRQVAADPAIVASLRSLGVDIKPLTQQQTTDMLKAEIAVNNKVIAQAHIPVVDHAI
jgi:tripartite-type tricarboxylate transporter receptor subunit TctC